MRRWSPTGIVAVLALCLLAGLGAGRAAAQVVINEILADPASDWDGDGALDTRADEWVEVANRGQEAVDLGDFWLRDDAASEPRLRLHGLLAAGAVAVFYGSDAEAWQDSTGNSGAALSLNNGGDVVWLLRTVPGSDPPATEVVDSAAYPTHAGEDDRACGWDTLGGTWVLFDGLNPYGGDVDPVGTGCAPTPGEANLCDGEVADEAVSFGDAKALWR